MLNPKEYAKELSSKYDEETSLKMLNDIVKFYENIWIYPKGQRNPNTNIRSKSKKFEKSSIYMYVEATKSYLISGCN